MPIDLNGCLKGMSNKAFGSPILNSILGSSVFVALVIAFVMIILIMVMYPAKKGTSFTVIAKMFLYMTFTTLLVVFLHDGVIKYMIDEEREMQLSESFMQNITEEGRARDPVYGNAYRNINPGMQSQSQPQPQMQPLPIPQQPIQPIQPAGTPVNNLPQSVSEQQVPVKGGTDIIISAVEGGSITGGRVLRGPTPPKYTGNPYA
jgi:hypothetical protein